MAVSTTLNLLPVSILVTWPLSGSSFYIHTKFHNFTRLLRYLSFYGKIENGGHLSPWIISRYSVLNVMYFFVYFVLFIYILFVCITTLKVVINKQNISKQHKNTQNTLW